MFRTGSSVSDALSRLDKIILGRMTLGGLMLQRLESAGVQPTVREWKQRPKVRRRRSGEQWWHKLRHLCGGPDRVQFQQRPPRAARFPSLRLGITLAFHLSRNNIAMLNYYKKNIEGDRKGPSNVCGCGRCERHNMKVLLQMFIRILLRLAEVRR